MTNSFSPNMIKTYITCPKKYYYQYIERLSMPKSSLPFEKGKKIHALANYYLQGIKIDRIETALNEKEKIAWKILKQNLYYNMDFVKSEFQLSVKLSDFWLGGRIDAIVKNREDYYILDYKTGKAPDNPEFDPQTMVYLLCVDKYLKTYNKLSFVYINLKENKNHVIEFNDDLKNQYEQKLINYCRQISTDVLYKENLSNCKYCEFQKFCNTHF